MATTWYSFDLGKIISERLLCLSGRGEIFKPSDNLIDFLEAVALEKEDELIHTKNLFKRDKSNIMHGHLKW